LKGHKRQKTFRGIWPMPLPLLNQSALTSVAQRMRIPTSARSIGFCVIWVCISSSSRQQASSQQQEHATHGPIRSVVHWPWPVFLLKWHKYRFVFRSKKAQISLLISFLRHLSRYKEPVLKGVHKELCICVYVELGSW
jgi:hypothetical protein